MSEEKVTRRGFAGWIGRALFAGLLGGALAAPAQMGTERYQRNPRAREFEGFSDRNDFGAALKDAIKKAERDWHGGRDDTLHWQLVDTSGVIGGRTGRGQVTVRIRVIG